MTILIKAVTRITLGFILLYGIYIALNAHIGPGGGFAGGVIVALSLVHVMLAFGKERALKTLKPAALRILMSSGALLFLYFIMKDFDNRCGACKVLAGEIIMPVCETFVVGFGFFAIFIAFVLMSKGDRDSE